MDYKLVKLEQFKVFGISVRTTNHEGRSGIDIGNLWNKFMSNNLIAEIPNKINEDIYCVYTDYESDYRGMYTALLGCKVSEASVIPEGFTSEEIPGGNYRVYIPSGKFPECVGYTWKHIWQTAITRKYTADFDRYIAGAKTFEETKVEVYLAIV